MNTAIIKFLPAVLLVGAVATREVKARETPETGGVTAAVQTMCPVLTDEKIDPTMYVEYQGKRVYLCCAMCRKKFLANPQAYIATLPQFAPAGQVEGRDNRAVKHDHVVDHSEARGIRRAIRFVGKFHPIAVHFPIALVLIAALAETLAFFTDAKIFENTARFNMIIAALSGIAAVLLGLAAGSHANYPAELARSFFLHKWLGIATCVLILVAAVLSELAYRLDRREYRLSYRAVLLLCVMLIVVEGYLGGQLVYGPNHYSW